MQTETLQLNLPIREDILTSHPLTRHKMYAGRLTMPPNTWASRLKHPITKWLPRSMKLTLDSAMYLARADNVITFKYVVKSIAYHKGYYATFMPKPLFGINGSGMHSITSLFSKKERMHSMTQARQLSFPRKQCTTSVAF
jgi:hypothetical protein